jgi:hypothetical protein
MRTGLRRFVGGLKELGEYLLGLKECRCPEYKATETFNRHSKLYGNDPDSNEGGRTQRGQRLWCCPRGQWASSITSFKSTVAPFWCRSGGGV